MPMGHFPPVTPLADGAAQVELKGEFGPLCTYGGFSIIQRFARGGGLMAAPRCGTRACL